MKKQKMLTNRYLVIEGNIGAGKTTLAQLISQRYKSELVLEEFAENTFLSQFYEDPERFAFPLEMSFMAERYRQLKNIFNDSDQTKNNIVSDYLFDKSLLFAEINLKKDEFGLFKKFFDLIKDTLPQPDLIVFLKKDVPQLKKNIQKRGRDFEKKITDSYLHRINEGYKHYLKNNLNARHLIIDSEELDFVKEKKQLDAVLNQIENLQYEQ